MRIRKPWTEWDPNIFHRDLPGAMGVYELADESQQTLYIGYAGGHSPFGIRGELFSHFITEPSPDLNWQHPRHGQTFPSIREKAKYYRYEVNHNYYSRWIEVLSRFKEDHGGLPPVNENEDPQPIPPLGRYNWKSEQVEP